MNCSRLIPLCAILSLLSAPVVAGSPDSDMPAGSTLYLERVDSGRRMLAAGHPAEAERLFKLALREEAANPSNALVLANLSEAQRLSGKPEEALESCEIGLIRFPASTTLRLNRAKALLEAGRGDEAASDLDYLLEALPDSADTRVSVMNMRLALRMRAQEWGEAVPLARGVAERASEDAQAWLNLAVCLSAASYQDPTVGADEAEAAFRRSLEIEEDADAYVRYITFLMNRNKEVSEEIRKAIAAYPENWEFYVLRAMERRSRYDYDSAEKDLSSAISLGADPELIKSLFPKR